MLFRSVVEFPSHDMPVVSLSIPFCRLLMFQRVSSALSFVQSAMFRLSSSSASATLICPKMRPFFVFSFEVCAIRLSMVAFCASVSTPAVFSASALFFRLAIYLTLFDLPGLLVLVPFLGWPYLFAFL